MSFVTEGLPSQHSPAEKRIYDIATTEGRLIGWVFNRHLALEGEHYYLDLAHDESKIVIEIDGYQHTQVESAVKDRERDAMLHRHGWTVQRWDHARALREPYGLIDWAEVAVIEIPPAREAARQSAEARRLENKRSAARRRVSKLVTSVVEWEVQIGRTRTDQMGVRTKSINTKLMSMFGAARDRTTEEHDAAYARLYAWWDAEQEKEDEAQRAAAHELLQEERVRVMQEMLADYPGPGSTIPELIEEANSYFKPDGDGGQVGGCWHYYNEYGDDMGLDEMALQETLDDSSFTFRPIPGYEDDHEMNRWYNA